MKDDNFIKVLYETFIKKEKLYSIHNSCIIENGVEIGKDTNIQSFTNIGYSSKIGKNCFIGHNCTINPMNIIGNNVVIENNVSLSEGLIIEDDVYIGSGVTFLKGLTTRSIFFKNKMTKKTIIKKGCTIGNNSTILCGVTIGEYSLIEPSSVIINDVREHSVMSGNPAIYKWMICKCGKTYGNNYVNCDNCKG